jgi:hypothetical protein
MNAMKNRYAVFLDFPFRFEPKLCFKGQIPFFLDKVCV